MTIELLFKSRLAKSLNNKTQHASVLGKINLPVFTCAGVALATLTFKVSLERPAVFGLTGIVRLPAGWGWSPGGVTLF
ncbi:MAG: hypothetical protein ACO4AN_03415 [Candidatus Nanopelagicales bacterium]